jgi:hypothetical protein
VDLVLLAAREAGVKVSGVATPGILIHHRNDVARMVLFADRLFGVWQSRQGADPSREGAEDKERV